MFDIRYSLLFLTRAKPATQKDLQTCAHGAQKLQCKTLKLTWARPALAVRMAAPRVRLLAPGATTMRLLVCLLIGGSAWLSFYSTQVGCDDRAQADEPPRAVPARHDESWYAVFIEDTKVGHRHVIERRIERAGQVHFETAAYEHIELVREGQRAVVDVEIISREKTDGELIDVEYQMPIGPKGIRMVARVDGQTLRVQTLSEDRPPTELPWPEDAWGPFGIESSLRSRPMQPKETRTICLFLPAVGQVIDVTLHAVDWEMTGLLGGEYRLLRIDMRLSLPGGAEMTSNLWIDRSGEIWKDTQKVGVTITAYRTTRQSALAAGKGRPLDLFRHALIPSIPPLENPHRRAEIEYELSLPQGDPSRLFRHDTRQQVRSNGPNRARLVVRASSPSDSSSRIRTELNQPTTTAEVDLDLPTKADQVSNSLATSDDPRIRKLAQSVLPSVDDPRRVAIALERFVYGMVEEKSYGQVFASATEVIDLREGDCTEHSVLLVALCRARGIPARAAMGLVYSDAHEAFAYHMWTEVWTGERWIGLDATRGDGQIGPAHLKMATSSLDGPTALVEMLTILQSIDGLKIKVVRVR